MDRTEFEQHTSNLRPQLLAHCYRMMGSPADAEDQVQETYLRAWRSFHDFDGRSSVKNWMYRIATNSCLNALAAAGRRVLPMDFEPGPGDPRDPINPRMGERWVEPLPDAMLWQDASPTPEEQFLARENIALAWVCALQQLSPQQRAVLLLRDVLSFSAADTADTLGTTVASVNSALQRSRKQIGDGLTATSGADVDDAHSDTAVELFADAFNAHDFDAIVNALVNDATWQMPPFDRWYRGGHDCAVLAFTHCPAQQPNDLRFIATRANLAPALGMYLRKGQRWEAFQFMSLSIHDGRVATVTTWVEPTLFRLAGLPLAL